MSDAHTWLDWLCTLGVASFALAVLGGCAAGLYDHYRSTQRSNRHGRDPRK